jgi:hypothetical protein
VPRDLRQTQNRELFRAINEHIAELAERLAVNSEPQVFICECSTLGCTARIEAPMAVYAQVRETPNAYLVLAGHEVPSWEQTIVGHRDYRIVVSN